MRCGKPLRLNPAILERSEYKKESVPVRPANTLAIVVLALACVWSVTTRAEETRFLVYFEEWSARLSPDAERVIAEAAKKATEVGAPKIRIEGRASAIGSPKTNKLLAETRTSIVADELQHDGVAGASIHEIPIGQIGSGDTGVTDRRVDIIIERQ
jgi:outer membrane protein OmpA-like peptidoglycan-associated protein